MPNYFWDGINVAIVSLIVSGISYGAYPYYLSKTQKEPITTKKLKYHCILYTIFIFILWCVFDELTKHVFRVFDFRGGAIIFGLVFYYSAKGRLRGRKLLTENPGRKKKEKPTFDVTERQYDFAMQIINYGVHSKEIKDIAKEMGKTPKETMDYFYEVIRNYNLKRYGEQKSTEQISAEPEQKAILLKLVEVEPEKPAEQPEKEPEIQRWYTCPKCGQLVKDGEECDCEAVKLALEEEKKKKEEQKQKKRQALKKTLPLYAVCAVLLVAVCVLAVYSYTLKVELDDMTDWSNMITNRYEKQKEEIKELKNKINILQWKIETNSSNK